MIKTFIGLTFGLILGWGCTWFYYESILYGQFLTRYGHSMMDLHTFLLSRDSNNVRIDDIALYDFCLNHKKLKNITNPDLEWHHHWTNFYAERIAVKKAEWHLGFIPLNDKYLEQCKNVEHP